MRIVLTGGGTGGHITPLEPVIESLRTVYGEKQPSLPARLDPEHLELFFAGIVQGNTREFFERLDVKSYHVPSGKLRRYLSHLTVIDMLFRLPFGVVWALMLMWYIMPDVVISKGSYGSLPVVVAAALLRIPILLHESDAVSGLANSYLARLANTVAVGFEETQTSLARFAHKTIVTGTPVRSYFGRVDQTAAKRKLNIPESDFVVLINGGSQGAQQLNELVLKLLPSLLPLATVIHLTGEQHFKTISTVAKELLGSSGHEDRYRVFPYLTDTMDQALSSADVVVARAGATTLAELARLRKASLLIPLASAAHDHQRKNAAVLESAGAARVLDPVNATENLFNHALQELIDNADLRASLAEHIAAFDHPEAGRVLAELSFTLAQGLVPTYSTT